MNSTVKMLGFEPPNGGNWNNNGGNGGGSGSSRGDGGNNGDRGNGKFPWILIALAPIGLLRIFKKDR